jgi:hypothetical protein
VKTKKPCIVEGCRDVRFARRLCRMHYARRQKGRPMEPPKNASRLTKAQVDDIMTSADTHSSIALRNGVSVSYVRLIRKGKREPVVR